jgi:hypothetical protein
MAFENQPSQFPDRNRLPESPEVTLVTPLVTLRAQVTRHLTENGITIPAVINDEFLKIVVDYLEKQKNPSPAMYAKLLFDPD